MKEEIITQSVFGAVTPTFTITPVNTVGFDLTVLGYSNGTLNKVSITLENIT